jgi:hypothetical protein
MSIGINVVMGMDTDIDITMDINEKEREREIIELYPLKDPGNNNTSKAIRTQIFFSKYFSLKRNLARFHYWSAESVK